MTIRRMVELNQGSRASFYRHQAAAPAGPDPDMNLRDAIQRIALEFSSYGRPQITAELKRRGWEVNHKRVHRILREDNLLCLRRRKYGVTTDSGHALRVYPNRKVPYFGICLGMQCAVIEFARNACGLQEADSSEFNPATPHRVIYKLRELRGVDELGGTMRLGAWPCRLVPETFAHEAYGAHEISERHRHRYEYNREYEEVLVANGLRLSGASPDNTYVEIVEVADHPWFLGCQFHPEFKSKPLQPHPLFRAFVGAAYDHRKRRLRSASQETVPVHGSRPSMS